MLTLNSTNLYTCPASFATVDNTQELLSVDFNVLIWNALHEKYETCEWSGPYIRNFDQFGTKCLSGWLIGYSKGI